MPSVFISYSHDSPAHLERILMLSNRLREAGVDCRIDQYEESPPEGWPRWCDRQVEESAFVLVVCTEIYLRRFQGKESPQVGRGVTWEGHIITQELYNAQGRNTKFIPVALSKDDARFVPITLQSATEYRLPEGYDLLYRRLTNQPRWTMPDLGKVKSMPTLERKQDFQTVWQVPHPRNPFFTGREKILEDLVRTLGKRKSAALSGLGGVGKTQTAVEYAYTHRSQYTAVLWVKAESRGTLLADFASIAAALNLPSAAAKEQALAVAEVRRWLDTHSGWLLILDNADDLDLAKEFLPRDPQGDLLLTTRARALGGLAERLPVDEMEPEEGARLLLRRAGLADNDRTLALQISSELGGLPLALDQAGAFIEETPCSLSEYFEIYLSEKEKLLGERGRSLGDHPSVTVTFSLAFDKTAADSAAAGDLVRLCAFLAPDAIPEEIFTKGAAELGENLGLAVANPLAFANVLKAATRFSLLDRDTENKTLDIHRLVQTVVQAGMSGTERLQWAERAVRAVERAFPQVEFANWGLCQRLLSHARACGKLIDSLGFEFREAARLLNQTAYYLRERALFVEAEPLYQFSLAILEKALGPDHPDFATGLNNLASLYDDQGKYGEAEPLYRRSLAIREQALGPDHPDVATSLNNLAEFFRNQEKYDEVEPLYRRSLAIWQKALGADHPQFATGLNNLALLYKTQGKRDEAALLYKRSLAIRERALGVNHPDVAVSLNNLAVLCENQSEYGEAEPLYQRSLAILEKALGPDHPTTIIARANLDRNRSSM
jgi:tetratricopeptide (TPR) repeat protein